MFPGKITRRATAAIAATAAAGALTIGSVGVASAANSRKPPPGVSRTVTGTLPHGQHIASLHSAVTPSRSLRPRDPQDGSIQRGELVQWFFANFTGSLDDGPHNDPNLTNNRFITAGSGQGAVVGADAESVWNSDLRTTAIVCTGLNYTGTCGTVGPNVAGNYTSTFSNNVRSVIWADSTN